MKYRIISNQRNSSPSPGHGGILQDTEALRQRAYRGRRDVVKRGQNHVRQWLVLHLTLLIIYGESFPFTGWITYGVHRSVNKGNYQLGGVVSAGDPLASRGVLCLADHVTGVNSGSAITVPYDHIFESK